MSRYTGNLHGSSLSETSRSGPQWELFSQLELNKSPRISVRDYDEDVFLIPRSSHLCILAFGTLLRNLSLVFMVAFSDFPARWWEGRKMCFPYVRRECTSFIRAGDFPGIMYSSKYRTSLTFWDWLMLSQENTNFSICRFDVCPVLYFCARSDFSLLAHLITDRGRCKLKLSDIICLMAWVIGWCLSYACGFSLGSSSGGSLRCHCLSAHHTSYRTVYFPLALCVVDGVRMVQLWGIIGFSLNCQGDHLLMCIFW